MTWRAKRTYIFSDVVRTSGISQFLPLEHLLQWSHIFSDVVRAFCRDALIDQIKASMEPHLFRCGKAVSASILVRYAWLQWSHIFSDVVSLAEMVSNFATTKASMEPHLFRCGKRGLPSSAVTRE